MTVVSVENEMSWISVGIEHQMLPIPNLIHGGFVSLQQQ